MKILALEFERAYSEGMENEYSEEVQERFLNWFDDVFLGTKYIEYDNADEIVFNKMTDSDKKRVKKLITEYSE